MSERCLEGVWKVSEKCLEVTMFQNWLTVGAESLGWTGGSMH